MANPTIDPNTIARRKPIGEALNEKDSVLPVMALNKHNTTPPSLADGDVVEDQADDLGNKLVALGDPAQVALLSSISGLGIPAYDYVSLTYTLSNLTTVVFKTGGSGGTTVATLTLAYDVDNNLTSVTKT